MKMDKYILDINKMTEVEKENYKKIIKRNVIKTIFKVDDKSQLTPNIYIK